MIPVYFDGATEYKKPPNMTDEQCSSIFAASAVDQDGFTYFLTAWKPSKEDLEALNRGEPVYVKTVSGGLPPMLLFTTDEKGGVNE